MSWLYVSFINRETRYTTWVISFTRIFDKNLCSILTQFWNIFIFFHRILQRLDSPVEIEANAAIFAADKLCSKTEKFSALAYEKFVTLLQGIVQVITKNISINKSSYSNLILIFH